MRFIAFFIVVVLSAPMGFAAGNEGKALFEEKCIKCHSLERALDKTKDFAAWSRTTSRMSRYAEQAGVTITPEEAVKIAEYLANRGKKEEEVSKGEEAKSTIKQMLDVEKHEMFDFKKVRIGQFIEPGVCESCHSELFKQWSGSMHSKAFADPLWQAATKLFFKDAVTSAEILEMKACVKCHTPLGFRSYAITSPEDEYEKLAALPAQGIFCNWCHNISEVRHLGDAGYDVEPGGGDEDPSTMLGPFKDADSPYHPSKYSELHTKSEFCGLCHDVTHSANKLPLEQTYTEWKNSPYNTGDPETTVQCQDCHMRQRPGIPSTGKTERPDNPGKACDMGPERDHVWTHYFVGANSVVTKLLGSDMHSQMAVERLQNAADLELLRNVVYNKNEISDFSVKIINSGAGHYLPTGLTELRQMWLSVKVTDAAGTLLYLSGDLDETRAIDKDVILYHTVLGDKDGEPVMNVAKADRILYDLRIPPKGYTIQNFPLYIPDNAVSPIRVDVTLKYRSVPQDLANTLLGDKAPEIPVIDMVSISEEIKF